MIGRPRAPPAAAGAWVSPGRRSRDAIGFAETILELLDEGRYTEQTAWSEEPDRTASVARGIYLRLPPDARLWLRRREFVDPDRVRLAAALAPGRADQPRARNDASGSASN